MPHTVDHLLEEAARQFGDVEIVDRELFQTFVDAEAQRAQGNVELNTVLNQRGAQIGLPAAFLAPARGERLEDTNTRIQAQIEAVEQVPQQGVPLHGISHIG